MNSHMLVGLTFLMVSIGGFLLTPRLLPEKATPEGAIVVKDETPSANVLFKRGKRLYKEKQYLRSFRSLEAAFDRSKPRTLAKKLAALYLGMLYYHGHGTRMDLDKAASYLEKEAPEDNRWRLFFLGRIYSHRGYKKFDVELARQYMQAANRMGLKAAGEELKKNSVFQ